MATNLAFFVLVSWDNLGHCKGKQMKFWRMLLGFGLVLLVLGLGAYLALRWYRGNSGSNQQIYEWLVNPDKHLELNTASMLRCPNAPFIIPSEGFIGLLWRDSAAPYNR